MLKYSTQFLRLNHEAIFWQFTSAGMLKMNNRTQSDYRMCDQVDNKLETEGKVHWEPAKSTTDINAEIPGAFLASTALNQFIGRPAEDSKLPMFFGPVITGKGLLLAPTLRNDHSDQTSELESFEVLTIVEGDARWGKLLEDGTLPDGSIPIWYEKESRIIYIGLQDKVGVGTVKLNSGEWEFLGQDGETHAQNFKVLCLK